MKSFAAAAMVSVFVSAQMDHGTMDGPVKLLTPLITAETTNNQTGFKLDLLTYAKDNEGTGVRELHGEVHLTTSNLPDDLDINFGFIF